MFLGELVQPLVHCLAYDHVIPVKATDNVVTVHYVMHHTIPMVSVQLAGYLSDKFIRVNAELTAVHNSRVVNVNEVCHDLNVWYYLSNIASFELIANYFKDIFRIIFRVK
jgi:hypothetical protein